MSLIVDIRKYFKGFILDVSFETKNEYLALLGASGSGKSMTLKCIAGVETPDEGRIILNDRILYDSKRKINLRPQERNIGFLFQNYALFPNMTVKENIAAGLKSLNKNRAIIDDMIKLFQLTGLEDKYPSQLSGGQRQRVALARSIIYKPDLLLLDEPFSALDFHLKRQVQTEMIELLELYKGEVLMVTHSIDEALRFCKNLVIIDNGKSVLFCKTKEIFKDPKIVSAARLIGCNNISPCYLIDDSTVYAVEWDLKLKINRGLKDMNHIGIYSNSFKICETNDGENTIECEILETIEQKEDYTVIFKNKNSSNGSKMFFDIGKEAWNKNKNKKELFLKVNADSILLLKD
jgi:molybdate transport system ATP-binding protein